MRRLSFPVWRLVTMAVILLASGGVIAWLAWPEPPPKVEAPPPPRISVAGTPLPLTGDPVADALDLVRRYAREDVKLVLPDGTTQALRPALLGAEIDRARLGDLVKAALDPQSPLGRAHLAARSQDPEATLALPIPIRLGTHQAVERLVSIKAQLDRPATDATVDVVKRELLPDEKGYRLDVYGTLARLDQALRRGSREVEAVVDIIEPRVVASQLGNVKFDEVLGYFETRYSLAPRYRARSYNLHLAASRLDGTVLLPGETFDFNETVGPRDEANGYKVAPVIAQGELVDGIGGGTCQISGTLHGAAFFSGLDIVERVPHSRPSSYIKLGLDAAVAYPSINYRIRNNFDFPIVLHETVKDGRVRAEILGPKRQRTVSFFRRIDEIIPFEEEIREVDNLPKGERVLSQRGVPGFKTTVFRITRDGAYAVRSKFRNHYPPTTQIVKVGTGAGTEQKVKEDNSDEYRADEYLVVVQGPGIKDSTNDGPSAGGGMLEQRTPGRTGSRGWQKKMNLPVFEDEPDDDDEDEG